MLESVCSRLLQNINGEMVLFGKFVYSWTLHTGLYNCGLLNVHVSTNTIVAFTKCLIALNTSASIHIISDSRRLHF